MRWQAHRGVLNPLDALATRQRVVAGGQRAPAAGRMRIGRPRRRPARRAVVAGRAAVDGVHRETDGAQLVPSSQREHRGRLLGAPRTRRSGEPAGALLHERRARPRPLRPRARRGAAPGAGTLRPARPPARRPPARDGGSVPLTPPRAPKPLSARARRRELYRRRAASWPDARLRGDRAAAAAHVRVVRRGASASHACSSLFATAARSTRGPSNSDTCGAPRTCHTWGGFSNAPPGPGETRRAFRSSSDRNASGQRYFPRGVRPIGCSGGTLARDGLADALCHVLQGV